MATILVLCHKHMKLVEPFTPHVIAWSVKKGFNQVNCRAKMQKTRLQCVAGVMLKSVMSSAKKCKVSKEKRRKNLEVLAKISRLKRIFQQNF